MVKAIRYNNLLYQLIIMIKVIKPKEKVIMCLDSCPSYYDEIENMLW